MNFLKSIRQKAKRDASGVKLYMSTPFVNATLVNGSLTKLIKCPKYVDVNEWLAANTFDLFYYVNLFYGTISEFCTPANCPVMCAGSNCEYIWTDSQKKSFKVPAPQYIDYVMTYIQNMVDDEATFPTKSGVDFPRDFQIHVRGACKQMFRVFGHIYHSHYDKILHMSCEGHLNTLFAHFYSFCKEFDLLEKKELAPMADFITELETSGRA